MVLFIAQRNSALPSRAAFMVLMVSKEEVTGVELRRISQDVHSVKPVSRPLAVLDENTCNDLHTELCNFSNAENRSWPLSNKSIMDDNLVKATITWKPLLNKRHMDDGLVKAIITWKPFGDGVKDETDDGLEFLGTTGITSQNCKSPTTTYPYRKIADYEKENMESGSEWTRESLDFPTSCGTDGKRLQSDFEDLSKPVTRLAFEVEETGHGVCSCVCGDKLMNDYGTVARRNLSAGPSKPILEKLRGLSSPRGESDSRPQHILVSTKAPTYDKGRAQNIRTHPCNSMGPEIRNTSVFSQSRSSSMKDSQACEAAIHTQHNDHFVILFAEQKNTSKEGSAGRMIRQELAKLSSLCTRYSHKFLSSMTSLVGKQSIKGSVRCVRRAFSSPRRGFVKLNSQNLPEFSPTAASSVPSNKKLAKDKELKAVLMKINEVLTSMEKNLPVEAGDACMAI